MTRTMIACGLAACLVTSAAVAQTPPPPPSPRMPLPAQMAPPPSQAPVGEPSDHGMQRPMRDADRWATPNGLTLDPSASWGSRARARGEGEGPGTARIRIDARDMHVDVTCAPGEGTATCVSALDALLSRVTSSRN